jgi:hypothetical protein
MLLYEQVSESMLMNDNIVELNENKEQWGSARLRIGGHRNSLRFYYHSYNECIDRSN